MYLKRETWLLVWGIITLLLGQVGTFVVPLYVGWVIDAMSQEDWNLIGNYCLELTIIIVVSALLVNTFSYHPLLLHLEERSLI